MKFSKKYLIISIILLLQFSMASCTFQIDGGEKEDSSEFIDGVDGWRIEGDAKGDTGVIPNFSPIKGLDDSGYIYAIDDAVGGVWYFVAPSKYLGNKSEYFNGKLEFWLIQDSEMKKQFDDEDLIIKGDNGEMITYKHETYPTKEWTHYEVTLGGDKWLDEKGEIATEEKIKKVLTNVTKLMIRGEFEDGNDTGGLDGVHLLK